MDQILATVLAAIISATVGGFVGSLITIARFGAKMEAQATALQSFVNQRAEDRETERRENERLRQDFRDFCANQNTQRERELEFIRREFTSFRNISDRRQRYMMDLITAIARKEGITHRITDGFNSGDDDDNG